MAASLVRMGRVADAQAVVSEWLKARGHETIALEPHFPLVQPYEKAWLDDLRAAGLP